MNEKTMATAKKFHIYEKVKKLEEELLKIKGIVKVEFDLNGFYDDMNEVIILTKYDIPVTAKDFFVQRKKLISEVLSCCAINGLKRTVDKIEDYGCHFYFVMSCRRDWKEEKS